LDLIIESEQEQD